MAGKRGTKVGADWRMAKRITGAEEGRDARVEKEIQSEGFPCDFGLRERLEGHLGQMEFGFCGLERERRSFLILSCTSTT